MIVDGNFSHHYMLVLYRLGEAEGTVPVFVPQQMTLGALEVTRASEGPYELRSENFQLRAMADEEGRLLRLSLVDSNILVERCKIVAMMSKSYRADHVSLLRLDDYPKLLNAAASSS